MRFLNALAPDDAIVGVEHDFFCRAFRRFPEPPREFLRCSSVQRGGHVLRARLAVVRFCFWNMDEPPKILAWRYGTRHPSARNLSSNVFVATSAKRVVAGWPSLDAGSKK